MNDALEFIVLSITYLICILIYKNNNTPQKILKKLAIRESYKIVILYIVFICVVQIILTSMLSGVNILIYRLILGIEMGFFLSFIPYISKKK
ncbi:hypothetical protein [Cellulosilyticum ruminicola]|uniref:hypothetical protein n=1 Tax=Cellulosilyticum ruminicola TaxID=425254 RepID=UPI0006D11C40|nr:hypothetical protein [Cellulosilyticum ruminicola]